ncbi:hypothetical protein [Nocardioides sp. SYSU DS0663]|uniref:hypothetical protein n=1 Tax=Nocardioides sp. SYSU DS0663 TaxID=3416445 RepID=UPI003F4AF91F
MTERLSALMHERAEELGVPPPPAQQILARGRQARRRRARIRASAFASLAVVCAAGFVALNRGPADEERLDGDLRIADTSRAMSSYVSEGAYAIDDELTIGANRFQWHEPIKALHYTSAGVVIQSGTNPDRDEGGSSYALVTPTGEWSSIDVALDDQIVGFETTSPRFAYAEPTDAGFDLVVHDAATDEEVARQPVELDTQASGWRAPPAAIHGDVVWVRGDGAWTEWDWRTGDVRPVTGSESTYEVAGGVWADWSNRERWLIRSMDDGNLVGELDLRPGWYGFFSPDGRFMRAFPNMKGSESSVDYEFFSVATGDSWQLSNVLDGHYSRVEFGWSPDGHILKLLDDTLSVCEPNTGDCEELSSGLDGGTVRLGGEPYTS